MWGNIVAIIQSILKKKNYKTKFSTNSIFQTKSTKLKRKTLKQFIMF
jgi:hypothetical protein